MRVRHNAGFWIVAVTFLLVTAYSTVPTPLYPLVSALSAVLFLAFPEVPG